MKKILGISLVAMMVATAANAEIASKQYVDAQDSATLTSAQNFTTGKIGTLATDPSTEQPYATVADAIAGAVTAGTSGVLTTSNYSTTLGSVYAPIDVLDSLDVDTVSGAGNVVTAVTQTDGTIAVTKGITALQASDIVTGTTAGAITVDGTAVPVYGLATVATSGDYDDLTDKPTLGALAAKDTVAKTDLAQGVQDSLDAADSALQASDIVTGTTAGAITVDGTAVPVYGLATVATSGDYDDLTDKPTLGALAAKDTIANSDIANDAAIAKTKMASDVQTSLGLADTSLQKTTTVAADGQFVLTKKVTNGVASYAWEMITRTGNEGTAPATTGEQ